MRNRGRRGVDGPGLLRSLAAASLVISATVAMALGAVTGLTGSRGARLALDEGVGIGVLALGTAAGAVLSTGCLLLVASALTHAAGRSSRRLELAAALLTPALLRKAVAVTVGAGLGLSATTGAAVASEVDVNWTVTAGTSEEMSVSDRTDASPTPVPAAAPGQAVGDVPGERVAGEAADAPVTGRQVQVVAGDSLWSIAAAHLPDGATAAEVADAWPAWYETNREAIGADPDLLVTGLHLDLPDHLRPSSTGGVTS